MASEPPGSAPASSSGRHKVLPSGHPRPRYDLERLLGVAVEVFSQRGYDGTSVEHLSTASGLSKSSIYHHIDSKEDLLRLALEQAITPLRAAREEPAAQEGPAIDRLRYLIRRNVEVLCERVPYVTLLLRVHGNTETERWALGERRAFDAFVADIVQNAIDEGDLRPGADALTTARLIFGMINSMIEWYKPGRGRSPAELAGAIESLVLHGHSTREP